MIWYDSSNMSRLVLNHKMTKYSNIWANGTHKVSNDEAIPWIAASKSSDQKQRIFNEFFCRFKIRENMLWTLPMVDFPDPFGPIITLNFSPGLKLALSYDIKFFSRILWIVPLFWSFLFFVWGGIFGFLREKLNEWRLKLSKF